MHRGDLAAPVADRVLERVARDALAGGAGDDLDALRRVGPDAVLDPRVEVLGVLANDDQVDVLVSGLDALHAPGGTHIGVELERKPQTDIHAPKA